MRRHAAPLLAPALALLAGICLAMRWPQAGALPGVGSVVLGLLARRARERVLLAGLGWCLGLGAPLDAPAEGVDISRPVDLIGRPIGSWRRATQGWRVDFEVGSLRQGARVDTRHLRMTLYLAGVERAPRGGRLRVRGRLRAPRPALNGPRPPPGRWSVSVGSRRLVQVLDPGDGPLRRSIQRFREGGRQRLSSRPGAAAAMARALVLGDPDGLPTPWLLSLRRLGLGHLIAVSGLHVGLAAGLVWLVLWRLPPAARWIPIGVVVLLYLLLVGARPSLLRATAMSLFALGALATERRPAALNAWALALLGMVVWRPATVTDLGFQLTAAATLGLIWFAPRLAERWGRRLPAGLALALAAGAAAHLFTLPWSVSVFHFWTPGAIVLNLVAVPWTALTLTVAAGVLLVGSVDLLGAVAWWSLELVCAPYGWLAALPVDGWASVPTILPATAGVTVSAAVTWSLLKGSFRVALGVVLVGGVVLVRGAPASPPERHAAPELVMLDVGQGEAILLRDGGMALLVDGGGWRGPGIGSRVVLPALLELGVRRLDAVALTHPDRDHCGGLEEIVHLLPVGELWSSLGWRSRCYRALLGRSGVRLRPVWRGVERRLGRWRLEVLHPPAGERADGNERSLVIRARVDGQAVLLTGDVGQPTERALAALPDLELGAAVLKVGHHGSRHSSSVPFLERVRPRLALVSVGTGNPYGHPASDVLERLGERGVELWRTDQGGQIRLLPDGESWSIRQPWRGAIDRDRLP